MLQTLLIGRAVLRRAHAAGTVAACATAFVIGQTALSGPAWAATCTDGASLAAGDPVACTAPGTYTFAVPAGATSVTVDIVGAGGLGGWDFTQLATGGNGAEISGRAPLPAGTAKLLAVVGAHGLSTAGAGGSALFAQDANGTVLATIAIAGAGGGASVYANTGGKGGDAGASGVAALPALEGTAASGATPGTGGTCVNPPIPSRCMTGSSGSTTVGTTLGTSGSDFGPRALGGGGYAAGGNGAYYFPTASGGGGGGSSLVPGDLVLSTKAGTGGAPGQLGADGSVTLTANVATPPAAPTHVTAKAGRGKAIVSFSPPPNDGGSPITSYTVTSAPGGVVATCAASPCPVTGLSNGISYTFTVHATNARGVSPESARSNAVTPAAGTRPTGGKAKWYRDPLSKRTRHHLAPVPTHPASSHGRVRSTAAAYRTYRGRLAVRPSQARGHQLHAGQAVQLDNLFAFDSAALRTALPRELRRFARSLRRAHSIVCEGYTDYGGVRRHEDLLSQRRAAAVCRALSRVVPGLKVRPIGHGSSRPVQIGGQPADRPLNRRVDVVVVR